MKKHEISSVYFSSDAGEHRGVLQKVGWSDQKEDLELHLFKKNRFGQRSSSAKTFAKATVFKESFGG